MFRVPKIGAKSLLLLMLLLFVSGIMVLLGKLTAVKNPVAGAQAQCWTGGSTGDGTGGDGDGAPGGDGSCDGSTY